METINHVLFLCSVAAQVWSIFHVPVPVHGFSVDLQDNIEHLLCVMNKTEVHEEIKRAIPWLLWGIRKNRNSMLYANNQGDPNVFIPKALEDTDQWWRQQGNSG